MVKTLQDPIPAPLALALSKADLGKTYRDEIPSGDCAGTALIRISWALKVGDDYEQSINHTIPWQGLLALALSKLNGVTVEALVREYVERDEEGETPAITREHKAEAAAAIERIKGAAGKRPCRGKVTGDVVVTSVELAASN